MAVYTTYTADVSSLNPPESFPGAWVSHEFFSVLGVEPALGRGFLKEEESKGRRNVAVLSHGLWMSRFGADPAIVGRAVTINGEPHAVVGVLPQGFRPLPSPPTEQDHQRIELLWQRLKGIARGPDASTWAASSSLTRHRFASEPAAPHAILSSGKTPREAVIPSFCRRCGIRFPQTTTPQGRTP